MRTRHSAQQVLYQHNQLRLSAAKLHVASIASCFSVLRTDSLTKLYHRLQRSCLVDLRCGSHYAFLTSDHFANENEDENLKKEITDAQL